MTTKNRKYLFFINVILICVMLNMIATISEMTAYDEAGEVGAELIQVSQSN